MAIRVLIVDDSLTMRMALRQILTHHDFDLVGEATNGREAIDLCRELKPDVITMDMMLPDISGLAATEYIMAFFPTPIVVVSSAQNRGEVYETYDALAAGAVDVVEKPTGDEPIGAWESALADTLRLVARIRVISHPRAKLMKDGSVRSFRTPGHGLMKVVALGTSTGGPGVLVQILNSLPKPFPLPIVGVIHLAPAFANSFAEWLCQQTARSITFAVDGERLADKTGAVVLAPPDHHLRVANGQLRLGRDAERHSCRPSVDVLFESLALDMPRQVVACLLTGMGKDGAKGLLQLRKAGALTIAQDEASSVVYGMPREAVLLGAACQVLPLTEIASTLSAIAHGVGGV
jgi:two-component system, chemotaxis family, protein-glutamate methylesterase/glutaminase